jgi:hypothetical protein
VLRAADRRRPRSARLAPQVPPLSERPWPLSPAVWSRAASWRGRAVRTLGAGDRLSDPLVTPQSGRTLRRCSSANGTQGSPHSLARAGLFPRDARQRVRITWVSEQSAWSPVRAMATPMSGALGPRVTRRCGSDGLLRYPQAEPLDGDAARPLERAGRWRCRASASTRTTPGALPIRQSSAHGVRRPRRAPARS